MWFLNRLVSAAWASLAVLVLIGAAVVCAGSYSLLPYLLIFALPCAGFIMAVKLYRDQRNISYREAALAQAPQALPVAAPPDAATFEDCTPFGTRQGAGSLFSVPDADREMHVYINGQSGYGKSGLVENLALADICAVQKAVVVFDYHGDLAQRIVAATPPEHLGSVYVLDILDEANPISINLFTRDNLQSDVAVRMAVNRVLHLFFTLWPETKDHAHLPNFVSNTVYTMLANDGTTLYDMYRMTVDKPYRDRLVANVPWRGVRDYWRDFDSLSPSDRNERSGAFITRLHQLFGGTSLMVNVLGQHPGKIDWRQIIRRREVVIIKLPGRTMEWESRLIGGILLAQLQAAVFAVSEYEERRPVSIYLDEFQAFATPDLEILLTEGRKYRAALHLSHQHLSQLEDTKLRDAVVQAETLVCFRTQLDDSRYLAPLFNTGAAVIRPEDVADNACERLLAKGSSDPVVQLFIDYYLRSLDGYRRGTKIELRNPGEQGFRDTAFDVGGAMLFGVPDQRYHRRVVWDTTDDPTPWLNDMLRRAMETGSAQQSIPPLAVQGFANSGPGFWPQVRRRRWDDAIFQPDYRFPSSLVVERNGTQIWIKEPENGTEQLLHCIFVIRSVMQYLALAPVGTETQVSDHDTAQMLRSLPKRTAVVRSGDEQATIYTLDNPEHVSGYEYAERLAMIQDQTRDRFCRPKAEVETAIYNIPTQPLAKKPVAAKQPVARWDRR